MDPCSLTPVLSLFRYLIYPRSNMLSYEILLQNEVYGKFEEFYIIVVMSDLCCVISQVDWCQSRIRY